jgi:hypothetical protein
LNGKFRRKRRLRVINAGGPTCGVRQSRLVSGGMANNEDAADALHVVLTTLAGRTLRVQDIYEAFGLSKARFYEARKDGTLLQRVDRIVAAAHRLGINPVELLVALVPGIEVADAVEYVDKRRDEAAPFLDKHAHRAPDVHHVSDYTRGLGLPDSEHPLKEGDEGA